MAGSTSHIYPKIIKRMYAIKHLFHIAQDRQAVNAALSTREGLASWWAADTRGTGALDSQLSFHFPPHASMEMQVVALEPGLAVSWQCLSGPAEWVGTRLHFRLDENEGKTRVRFAHEGWQQMDDTYAAVTFSWARFFESLRQYCQTGQGTPYHAPAVAAQ